MENIKANVSFVEKVRRMHLQQMKYDPSEVADCKDMQVKSGEVFKLTRIKVQEILPDSKVYCGYKTRYVVHKVGCDPFAQISVNFKTDSANLEYRNLEKEMQGKGIIQTALYEVEKDIFQNGVCNGFPTDNGQTDIETINLDILRDNYASIHIARSAGYRYSPTTQVATLGKEDFFKQHSEDLVQ